MGYNNSMRVTTYETLQGSEYGREYVSDSMTATDGTLAPTGIAGYYLGDCNVVCHECAPEDTEPEDTIFGDNEADYPGMQCDECNRWLDTYLKVYKSQDPKLFYRLEQRESLGFGVSSDLPTIEEIANEAERQAYELGWNEARPIDTAEPDIEADTPQEAAEANPRLTEPPTDSAHYANVIAPKLRGIAGYHDSGHGTYTDSYLRESEAILNESIHPAYRRGYHDRRVDSEYTPDE